MVFDDRAYRFEEIPELTAEQKKSPFARFYYEPVERPRPEVLAAIGSEQMDCAEALPFAQIERLFRPGSEDLKTGWCIMPDGTGYSHVITEMPDMTPEMVMWWTGWIMDPDHDYLNYRIWLPGLHRSHATPVIENLGWGFSEVYMERPLLPPALNLSAPPRELDPDFVFSIGSSGRSNPIGAPEDTEYTLLINCIKRVGAGIRAHTVGYMGVKWENGALIKMHDADPAKQRLFATHNAYEFHREGVLAPKIYEVAKNMPNMGLNPDVKRPPMGL